MVYIAFNSKTIKELFKQLLIFYMTSFVFGGAALALMYFIKPQEALNENKQQSIHTIPLLARRGFR